MAKKVSDKSILPDELIINKIYLIRGQKVMLDKDLAEMYGIEVRVLNQSVKRNIDRFPKDFIFTLTQKEFQVGEVAENFQQPLQSRAWPCFQVF